MIPADVDVYVPTLEDGLTLLEFVDADDKLNEVRRGSFHDFAERMRAVGSSRFFACDCRVPIYPRADGMTDAQIAEQLNSIVSGLAEEKR